MEVNSAITKPVISIDCKKYQDSVHKFPMDTDRASLNFRNGCICCSNSRFPDDSVDFCQGVNPWYNNLQHNVVFEDRESNHMKNSFPPKDMLIDFMVGVIFQQTISYDMAISKRHQTT